jgi:hypothetical protein
MSLTDEEKNEIVNLAVEKALLMLPEVVGNMMKQHATMSKLNSQFYSDYPEFKDQKDAVVSVIERIDAENPFTKYEDILAKAVPEIRKRIELVKSMSMNTVPSPNRDFSNTNVIDIQDANVHGAI